MMYRRIVGTLRQPHAHSDRSIMPLPDEFHELMRQQTSYAALVTWQQQQQSCTYAEACQQINHLLQQYRQHYADG